MLKRIPDYLRLHTEDPTEPLGISDALSADLKRLADALSEATGWPVRSTSVATGDFPTSQVEFLRSIEQPRLQPATSEGSAEQLLQATNRILTQLHEALHALWQREAELAAGVPVTPRADEEQHLAERLEAILRGGAQAVNCQAAALYLLDEGTTHLKLRASWGLPRARLLDPPRPLRGSVADLEALVGHAVVLEDTRLLPHWKAPESYPAAVCVPVSSPSTPLGTLWIFSDTCRDFSEQETELLEIVAGRIASELEREMLLVQGIAATQTTGQLSRITTREQQRLPSFAPLLDEWEFSGWVSPSDSIGLDFYDWGVLHDGRPYLALGGAEGIMIDAAFTAAVLHSSLRSHTLHPHDARKLLERVNDTIWSTSAGDQFASLFYALLDPDRPEIEFAFAGRLQAMIVGPRGTRPLTRPAALLGLGPDTPFPLQRECVRSDEVLIAVGGNILRVRDREGNVLREEQLAASLQDFTKASADEILDRLRTAVLHFGQHDPTATCTLLVARRK